MRNKVPAVRVMKAQGEGCIGWIRIVWLLSTFVLLFVVNGPQPTAADVTLFEVEVRQADGSVQFSFYLRQTQPTSLRIPIHVAELEVAFALPQGQPVPPYGMRGRTIWRVQQPQGGSQALTVTYGVIPGDFIQNIPSSGSAPPLEFNKEYVVGAMGDRGYGSTHFIYRGP